MEVIEEYDQMLDKRCRQLAGMTKKNIIDQKRKDEKEKEEGQEEG